MKQWGNILIVVGVIVAAIALFVMPSTISTQDMTSLLGREYGTGSYSETYNLPRAQLREMVFHGGSILFLGGIMLLVGGAIDERLRGIGGAPTPAPIAIDSGDAGDAVDAVPRPVYAAPDPAEAERNMKIVAGMIVAVVIVMAVLGVVDALKIRPTASPDTIAASNTAENASRAADEAVNAALNAADNAARAAK